MKIPQDKANHFIYSLLVCVIVFSCIAGSNNFLDTKVGLYRATGLSVLATFTIGNLKELLDYYTGTRLISWLNILANACGVATFGLIIGLVNILN